MAVETQVIDIMFRYLPTLGRRSASLQTMPILTIGGRQPAPARLLCRQPRPQVHLMPKRSGCSPFVTLGLKSPFRLSMGQTKRRLDQCGIPLRSAVAIARIGSPRGPQVHGLNARNVRRRKAERRAPVNRHKAYCHSMDMESPGDRIGWMLQVIAPELFRWISALDAWPTDVPSANRHDPYIQLKVVLEEWHRTFGDHLNEADKNYMFELKGVRNRWAHHESFTSDDLWRALDTGERLMRAIGADEATARLEAVKRRAAVSKVDRAPPELESTRTVTPKKSGQFVPSSDLDGRSCSEESVNALDPAVVDAARRALQRVVERAGGVHARTSIPVDYLNVVADLFEAWARHHGVREPGGDLCFGPQPGLWHALQGVLAIDDANRWDSLRAATVKHLEVHRGWLRETPPRGSRFLISGR
jgi:hypothetical protein